MNEKLKRYAELKAQQKSIEEEIDALGPEIKDHLVVQGIDKLPTSLGIFSIASKSTWKYTEAVEKLQAEEKAKGIARQVVTNYLRFSIKKDDE